MITQKITVEKWGTAGGIRLNQEALQALDAQIGDQLHLLIDKHEGRLLKIPMVQELIQSYDEEKSRQNWNDGFMGIGGFDSP